MMPCANFERATELDPRNVKILVSADSDLCRLMRDYTRARDAGSIALLPSSQTTLAHRGRTCCVSISGNELTLDRWHDLDKMSRRPLRSSGYALQLALYERDTRRR